MTLSVFKIHATDDPRKLSQAVIQIVNCLDMYLAELARVLGLQCGDIGQLSSGKLLLQPDSTAWKRALLFVSLYQQLYKKFNGDGPNMIHWMRTNNKDLAESPHLLIVDHGKLESVVSYINE